MTNVISFSNIESAIRRAPAPLKDKGRELKALQEMVNEGVLEPSVLDKALSASESSIYRQFGGPLIETYWHIFGGPIESLMKQIYSLRVKRIKEVRDGQNLNE